MKENPITGSIGVEITGVNLRQPIPDDLAASLRDTLDRNLVVVLRDQFLDIDQHRRLAGVFGAPVVNPYATGLPDYPEMTRVVKEADERTGVFGGGWHSDLTFLEQPPNGSVLCAIEVPPWGGDTLFSSQRAAWESLPDPIKLLLEGRSAVHVGKPYGVKWAPPLEQQAMKGSTRRNDPEADRERFHPAVLTHPVNGHRSLFVNETYTMRLDGLSEAESAPILRQVFQHSTLPEYCCRLRWSAGMVVVWDNYSTQHYAINDYHGHRREMRRTTFRNRPITQWCGAVPRTLSTSREYAHKGDRSILNKGNEQV
jgi:taurine dioxygenase